MLFFLSKNTNANDLKFGWGIGNIFFSYNISGAETFNIDLLHFTWIRNRFSFGFSAIEFYDLVNEYKQEFLITPFQLAFVPFNFRDTLFFSIYSKVGLKLTEFIYDNRSSREFYGAIGIRLLLFPRMLLNYSPQLSLFAQYSTRNELRFGIGMDASFIFYIASRIFIERQAERARERNPAFDWDW